MRKFVVAAVLLAGISSVLPGPAPVAAVPPVQTMTAATPAGQPAPSGQAAPATTAKSGSTPIPVPAQAATAPPESVDDVCSTLLTSAQSNDLPVAFFADLIWQESRLRDNALSPKGAMGIAQFMPDVAAKSGVANPFDPSQALPASAKLLHQLFDQFGNLGYVAAAYNAGARRVSDWLERGRVLPRETRDYVMDITGRSVEAWRKKPEDDADLRFAPQLPCRTLPAFAALEQAQTQHADPERKLAEQAYAEVAPAQHHTPVQTAKAAATAAVEKRERVAQAGHPRKSIRHEAVRTAERERPRSEHEAGKRIA